MESGAKIGGIVGDNCPTQVLALGHWSPSFIFKDHICAQLRGLRFFSCGVHTTALMLQDCVSASVDLSRLTSTLSELVTAVNSSFAAEEVGRCPMPVETRWLSRINSIDWLLQHEYSLRSLQNRNDLENDVKAKMQVFQFIRFEELRVLGSIIFPFYVVTLALEKDDSTQSMILPIMEQLKAHYALQKNDVLLAQYPGLVDKVIEKINHRISTTFDYQLICASCLLSVDGRAWFLTKIYNGEDKNIFQRWLPFCPTFLQFKYSASTKHPIFIPKKPTFEPQSSPEDDPLLSNVLAELEEEETPELPIPEVPFPPQSMENIYDNALSSLETLATDLGMNTAFLPAAFASWMFDAIIDEHIWKHKDASQFDLWRALSVKENMNMFARLCIRIVGVNASECAVERTFSLDKLILTRLRNRMASPLLDSRARIQRKYK